jgi:hypothetical protein
MTHQVHATASVRGPWQQKASRKSQPTPFTRDHPNRLFSLPEGEVEAGGLFLSQDSFKTSWEVVIQTIAKFSDAF